MCDTLGRTQHFKESDKINLARIHTSVQSFVEVKEKTSKVWVNPIFLSSFSLFLFTDGLAEVGQSHFRCPLLMAPTEEDCLEEERVAKDFFSDQSTFKRIQNCQNYFHKIETVAFEKVYWQTQRQNLRLTQTRIQRPTNHLIGTCLYVLFNLACCNLQSYTNLWK